MKTQFNILVSAVGLIALVGCGSQGTKLSQEQNDRFAATLSGTGAIERAVPSQQQPASHSRAAASVGTDDVSTKMAQRLTGDVCQVDVQAPATADLNFDARWTVNGNKCPIAMTYHLTLNTDMFAGKLSFDVDENYKVADSEYAKLNDVDALTAKGGLKMTRDDDKFVMAGSITGTLHSQKYGNISFTRSESGEIHQDGSGNVIEGLTLNYSDFSAELKVVQDGKSKKFYLNDQDITEDQYNGYLKKAGMMFQVTLMSNGNTKS